jgi:hypothetical protein
MFKGDIAGGKYPLVMMGGQVEGQACALYRPGSDDPHPPQWKRYIKLLEVEEGGQRNIGYEFFNV